MGTEQITITIPYWFVWLVIAFMAVDIPIGIAKVRVARKQYELAKAQRERIEASHD